MKRLIRVVTVLSVILSSGILYSGQEENFMQNETKMFLGDESSWKQIKIELQDIQGLFGGRNILISGSGKTVVEIVQPSPKKGPGLYIKRYEFLLTDSEIRDLLSIFIKNDFVTIAIKDRYGVPDEARPEIILINPQGKEHKIAVWSNGVNQYQRFADIYRSLLSLEGKIKNYTPISETRFR